MTIVYHFMVFLMQKIFSWLKIYCHKMLLYMWVITYLILLPCICYFYRFFTTLILPKWTSTQEELPAVIITLSPVYGVILMEWIFSDKWPSPQAYPTKFRINFCDKMYFPEKHNSASKEFFSNLVAMFQSGTQYTE